MPHAFAGYPAPFVFDLPKGTKTQQLIWGDFVTLFNEDDGEWTKVRSRRTTGWMKKSDLQSERLLEVNFIDIGQGDGVFIVTPDDRFILVDAGESDNMLRFLSWRFNLRAHPDRVIRIHRAVISHSDQDHYKGFSGLFKSPQFTFDAVYHNGIVERAGPALLGARLSSGGRQYLTDFIVAHSALATFLGDAAHVGAKQYPKMLKGALDGGRVTEIRALCALDSHVPGFDATAPLAIQVLAPVPESIEGQPRCRWLGSDGETKNGHSIVLRFVYRNVSVLLGGDLNAPSEKYLLGHYTSLDPDGDADTLVAAARATFQCDIAKACHHGSGDFTDLFLRAVNAIATVVSSGDNEPHAHPRPDALGALGKYGRGDRPLVFSTELARSANENIKQPHQLRQRIRALIDRIGAATTDASRLTAQKQLDDTLATLERSVAVYGLINLRTDGTKVLLAQKLERRRPNKDEWDTHRLEPDAAGTLRYVARH